MSASRFIRSFPRRLNAYMDKRRVLRSAPTSVSDLNSWSKSLTDPTDFYRQCVVFFHRELPTELREHRNYFSLEQRGFGEEAFHVMWWLLFSRYRPTSFLEIGVYRGQTLSLATLLQRDLGIAGSITGISPFTSSGDAVSIYRNDLDFYQDTLDNFRHFALPPPTMLKAFSTDPSAVSLIEKTEWDCIYIDGNHDYEVALADWQACSKAVAKGGIIVLDDSALDTAYRPYAFATGGHPGPSRLAAEIDRLRFEEVLRVGHNRVFQKL